jgi:signal transduction histidine kinase
LLNEIAKFCKKNKKIHFEINILPVILLVATPILWFFRVFMLINAQPLLSKDIQILSVGVCIVGIILSAIAVSNRASKLNRTVFLKNWVLLGFAVTFGVFLSLFFNSLYLLFIASGLVGAFFGLGVPVLLAYFSSLTKDTNRSTVSGAIFLIIGFFFSYLTSITSLYTNLMILLSIMLIAFISLSAIRPSNSPVSNQDKSWTRLSSDRTFLLYLTSMFMFMIGIFIVIPAANVFFPYQNPDFLDAILLAAVALIGGFLGDFFGRKILIMTGFFLAALSYSILSIFPYSVGVGLSYNFLYNASLAILYPMFLFTLWGDLSRKGSPEKYYVIGCLPFIIAVALAYSVGINLVSVLQPFNMYSLVSLFLFAAILPIAYATEILPKLKKIQELNEKLRVISNLTRHDINNKLTSVNAHTYLLKNDYPQQPDIIEHANEIEQAVQDSVRIFEFAKIYENLGVEELTCVNVGKAIDNATALFSAWNFKIVNECRTVNVLADSFLPQIFYNFLDNTRKYGKTTSNARFYYEKEKDGGIQLIYEDDGQGINADYRSKLFKEGFSTGGSTGYGLFLIKKMVDGYGWTIAEEGEPGKGVKFVVRIPFNRVSIL